MGVLKSTLGFLFGKEAKIFDENGEVRHQLPDKVWQEWQSKEKSNPQYNWRNHSGTKFRKK